jgi:7-cyano-7-deazaguanine synthase
MIPKTIIHLLSGGLDSVTMLYDLKAQGHFVHCLLFDYKQKHVRELTFAKAHCHRLGVLFTTMELPALNGLTDENWVVPNRNAIMLSLAVNVAVQAGADTITYGCNKDDADYPFPDCTLPFIQAMNKAVESAGYKIEICAPYLNKSKAWIGGFAQEIGVPIHEIWSCYRGGPIPCGTCPACIKLQSARK